MAIMRGLPLQDLWMMGWRHKELTDTQGFSDTMLRHGFSFTRRAWELGSGCGNPFLITAHGFMLDFVPLDILYDVL